MRSKTLHWGGWISSSDGRLNSQGIQLCWSLFHIVYSSTERKWVTFVQQFCDHGHGITIVVDTFQVFFFFSLKNCEEKVVYRSQYIAGARDSSPSSERRKQVQTTRTPPVAMISTGAVCCKHWAGSIAGRPGQCRRSHGHVVWSDRWTGLQPSYRGCRSGSGQAAFHLGLLAGGWGEVENTRQPK